jgi:hypothetical protein
MRWYVVSILISYRVKEGRQNTIPVYENFILFYADNEKEVLQKAVKYGEWCASIDDKTELDGKPAYSKYEGIRKITEIFDDNFDLKITMDAVELSYSYMELDSEKDVIDLAMGRRVKLAYVDDDE